MVENRTVDVSSGPGFAVIDVETTGPPTDRRIIEFAGEEVSRGGAVLSRYETLVRRPGPISSTSIHGLDAAALENAPTFRHIGSAILDFLVGRVVVAHNLSFDWSLLRREFHELGVTLPVHPRGVCTATVARKALGPPVDLRRLCNRLDIDARAPHTARGDVRATTQILLWLIENAPEHFPPCRVLRMPCPEGLLGPSKAPETRGWHTDPFAEGGNP